MTEKYTIDNAKNDIQNLQSQNLFDFQEIKRLEKELKKVNDELHLHLRVYNIKQLNDSNHFDEIKEDYNNLFNIIDNTIIDIGNLQTDVNNIKGNNNIYQTDIAALKTSINNLQNNLSIINTKITNLETIDTNINTRLNQVINTVIPVINGNINRLEQLVNVNIQGITDLNNRVTDLENNQDNTVANSLLTTVGNIRDRLNVAENNITNNKNKITDILTDINSIQNTLNTFDTRLIDVENIVLGNLTTRLHLYEVNLQRFDVELDQAQIDIELLYHLIEQGGGTGTGTGVTPELLQRLDNIEQSIIDTNIRIDNLQLTNIEQDVQLIRNTVTALQEQTNNLADDVMELADKVLNMDLSIMEDRITANENNITDLGGRVFNLESDNVQNKQDIIDINNRIDNLDIPDITDLENNVVALQEQVDNLVIPDITDLENSVVDLQQQVDNLDIPDITDLENSVTDLQEQLDNLDIPEDIDLTEINTKIAQLENSSVNKIIVHNIHQLTEWYAKITVGINTDFSKILVSDNFGGCILITGSLASGHKSIKVVRLSNGSWDSYKASDNTLNKIINVYFDGNFIYVHCGGYNALSIDGKVNAEKVTSLPTGATLLPILDLTQSNTSADITGLQTQVDELFQSVSNGKTLVANAITGKGISTSSSATFATMAQNIRNISTGENPYTVAYVKVKCTTNSSTTLTFNFSKAILALRSITPPNSNASVSITDYKTLGVSQYNVKLKVMNGSGDWEVCCIVYK